MLTVIINCGNAGVLLPVILTGYLVSRKGRSTHHLTLFSTFFYNTLKRSLKRMVRYCCLIYLNTHTCQLNSTTKKK